MVQGKNTNFRRQKHPVCLFLSRKRFSDLAFGTSPRNFALENIGKNNMKKTILSLAVLLLIGQTRPVFAGETWTLKACIEHALKNNLKLQKSRLNEASAETDVKQAKAALFPSLSASMTQSVAYRPFQESAAQFVNGSKTSSSSNKTSQTGSYGINASWIVWDGGKNTKDIKVKRLDQEMAQLTTETEANSIQEQIAQLYIQILYSQEAVTVNEALLKSDEAELERGQEMLNQGKLSKSELAQLEAQTATGRYDVVNAKTQVANYKLQLKQLLELTEIEEMEIAPLVETEEAVASLIPNKAEIYQAALELRPEIKSSKLNCEAAKLNLDIAKAGYMPSIRLTAGIGDNHMTGTSEKFFDQMKQNLNGSVGLTVSVPIFTNRENKSAVEKAQINRLTTQLDLQDKQKELYSSIETYWLNAISNQQKYEAAKSSVKSAQLNYDQMDEQFRLGLKNLVELTTSRTNLLSAQQEMLQSKYTTLLNMQLLKFYGGENINL